MLLDNNQVNPSIQPENRETTMFTFLSPGGGEIFEAGSKMQIIWKGGPALPQRVHLSLINLRKFQVILSISGEITVDSDPGVYTFTIPADLYSKSDNGITPIDGYQIYIGDTEATVWRYSNTFMIWCGGGSYFPVAKPFEGQYPLEHN